MSGGQAAGFLLFRRTPCIEFLLLQASYRDHHWSPPKGHLEKGEDFKRAAFRELEEETGIKGNLIRVDDFTNDLHYTVDGKPKIVRYWLAELIDPNSQVVISHEAQDFRWAEREEARRLAYFPDMQALIDRAHSYIMNK